MKWLENEESDNWQIATTTKKENSEMVKENF